MGFGSLSLIDRAKGCLLGGAIGDSLGASVEFLSLAQILDQYGPEGIQEPDVAYGILGAITDDTQLALFSAEGLIRAKVRRASGNICHLPEVVGYAYQRWLHTQGERCDEFAIQPTSLGWLIGIKELHDRRAPGSTCLSALRVWNRDQAKNDSKGCGTVMRSAPFGFDDEAWQIAWDCAAITHGHIEAMASAAILAETVRLLVKGYRMEKALLTACDCDRDDTHSARLLRRAVGLARGDADPRIAIRELGEGWVADEALGIAAFCALKAGENFEKAVRLAVNHEGDSDSTGAITGNLMGAAYGLGGIPQRWLSVLELRGVIERIATDLIAEIPQALWEEPTGVEMKVEKGFWERYPGC